MERLVAKLLHLQSQFWDGVYHRIKLWKTMKFRRNPRIVKAYENRHDGGNRHVARMRPAAKEAKEAKEAKVKESPRQALPIFLLFLDIINKYHQSDPGKPKKNSK